MKAKRTRKRRANVEVKETTYLPTIMLKLQGLLKNEVHIGMQGDSELAKIAGIHEYGSMKAGIPARSYIGSGRKKAQTAISKAARAGIKAIVLGNQRPKRLLNQLGDLGFKRMLKNFDRIRNPALSPVYAKRKSSRKILVQEQKLRDALTFFVVSKRRRGK